MGKKVIIRVTKKSPEPTTRQFIEQKKTELRKNPPKQKPKYAMK